MTDDEVVGAIHALVAAGEHLDQLLGVPGARLEGGGVFSGGNRRLYQRGSPEHLEARAAGLVEPLPPPPPPASPEAVEEAQVMVGYPLPGLLRRLYLEVGNGGFGPGYGILGVRGGHGDDYGRTAIDLDRTWGTPEGLLAICYLGLWHLLAGRLHRQPGWHVGLRSQSGPGGDLAAVPGAADLGAVAGAVDPGAAAAARPA
jgi:hypothetical protein